MAIVKRGRKFSSPPPPQVKGLYERGVVSVIPLFKGKSPGYDGWEKIDEAEAQEKFWSWSAAHSLDSNLVQIPNYGIRLGPTFGDIVDIDLDSQASRRMAKYYLPETATFGRASKGTTHYLYKQTGANKQSSHRIKWPAESPGEEKSLVIELRASGQTMGPGSIHPDTQERIEWTSEHPISVVNGEDLGRAFMRLTAASVLLPLWEPGVRDELALIICGSMLRSGMLPDDVNAFLEPIIVESGDDQPEKRLKADRVAEMLANDERVPGIPTLVELLGQATATAIIKWLSLGSLSIVEELNKEYAVSMMNGSAIIVRERTNPLTKTVDDIQFLNKESFGLILSNRHLLLAGKEVTLDKVWLSSPERRQYLGGIVFKPLWRGGNPNPTEYNLWSGFAYQPSPQGSWSIFRKHLLEELCNSDSTEFNWVMGWLAHRVQFPWKIPRSSIVMLGERGIGKGTIAQCFGALFGRHYMQVVQQSQLLGKFNSHLIDKVLVFADEAVWGGDKANEGVLKVMISEDMRTVEYKGKDTISVENCSAYMIASNNDWVVPVGRYERRFYISKMPGKYRRNFEYFNAMREELSEGGYERMLYDLQRWDLDGWRGDDPPITAALISQAIHNFPPETQFFIELVSKLANSGASSLTLTSTELKQSYNLFLKQSNIRGAPSELSMLAIMKNIFTQMDGPTTRRRLPNGERVRSYNMGSPELIKHQLNSYLGFEYNYD